jgi:hypothetical protein
MRGYGRGSLARAEDGVWVGRWTGGDGKPNRIRLSKDLAIAEARLNDEVQTRDARATSLDTIIERYVADLATRTKPKHVRNTGDQLRRVAAGLKELSPPQSSTIGRRAFERRSPIATRAARSRASSRRRL